MNPTCTSLAPAAASASTTRRHSAEEGARGFSQSTGFRATIEAIVSWACSELGAAISTAFDGRIINKILSAPVSYRPDLGGQIGGTVGIDVEYGSHSSTGHMSRQTTSVVRADIARSDHADIQVHYFCLPRLFGTAH